MINPELDGVTHINIYSKGKTQLGRDLSNFTKCFLVLPEGEFQSIEGYWYYLGTNHPRREELKNLYGIAAKNLGKRLKEDSPNTDLDFKAKIKNAVSLKINTYPELKESLKNSILPFEHYYVYNNKVKYPTDSNWLISHIETIRYTLRFL